LANAQVVAAPRTYPYLVLALGLFTASVGLILVRMALNHGLPPMVTSSLRMGIALLVFTPIVLRRYLPVIRQITRREWLQLAFAGLLFAGDLTLFSESIQHTSILLAAVIGGLSPLWTALLERLVLKTPLHRMIYIGLTMALAGSVLITVSGGSNSEGLGPNPLLGGLMALCSGLSASAYLVLARSFRPRIPLVPYMWMIFGFATSIVLVIAFFAGVRFTGYPVEGYMWVVLAALVSQLVAHPSFNYAVGYLSPTFISISAHSITVMASIMAYIFFQEVPGVGQLIGSAVILAGVSLAITGQTGSKST
jgi:drug/metabolite transporter (DMT)-like permease